jgi:hypothetical protein
MPLSDPSARIVNSQSSLSGPRSLSLIGFKGQPFLTPQGYRREQTSCV